MFTDVFPPKVNLIFFSHSDAALIILNIIPLVCILYVRLTLMHTSPSYHFFAGQQRWIQDFCLGVHWIHALWENVFHLKDLHKNDALNMVDECLYKKHDKKSNSEMSAIEY